MCGICGTLRFDSQAADPDLIQNMMRALERRGPDAAGHYHHQPIALGHRRLAIIDLTEKSNQPMVDEALGLVIVFNGTIYNYPDLRAQLIHKGHEFVSDGDTEVIVKAYAEWGEQAVERLHGMFAFAIWDNKNQSLFLARDRVGIKPLYYSLDNKRITFASNTQALLKDKTVDLSLNPVGLHAQFTLHAVVPAPNTVFNGVKKLEPATCMTIDRKGTCRKRVYWKLKAQRPDKALSEREWAEAIHDSLMQSVRKRKMIADVPVGVLLSGGLDSSLLVALLIEAGVEDLMTFSVGFEDVAGEKGSEFEFSDMVVDRYATRHHKIHIPNDQVLKRLPEAIDAMAEPMFGQDAVAFYLLAEQVSKQVKVVQSGQGADEVFAGYFWYPRMHEAKGSALDRFRSHYFDRDHDEYCAMMNPNMVQKDFTSELVDQALNREFADEYLDQVLRFDVTTLIVDDPVKRVDNMTMAWGLEARVPFLDHELIELAMQIPPEIKIKSEGKHILKMISRGLLPDPVIDRPKGYFPVPALKYVRGEFQEFMADTLTSPTAFTRDLYNRDYVQKLLAEPEQHFTRIQGSKLWHLALFELWMQRHVQQQP
jgi:asparagine synthase (glutamine-hydrolysing)